jgi:SAM-dependent methyltransferase
MGVLRMDALSLLVRRIRRHSLAEIISLIPVNIRFVCGSLKPAAIAARRHERAFDRELGIDTAGKLPGGVAGAEFATPAQIYPYHPVVRDVFDEMMGCLPEDISSFSFIDVGSGKGRAVVLAARRPFAEVIGVEISHRLHRIAAKNLEKISPLLHSAVEIVHQHARTFVFPTKPTVIFLFNPFAEDVMREVIGNIERTHVNSGLPVFLLYFWPAQERVIRERGSWREIGSGRHWKAFAFDRIRGSQ